MNPYQKLKDFLLPLPKLLRPLRYYLSRFLGVNTPKRKQAAQFFIDHFSDYTNSEINEIVEELWGNYRQWNKICQESGLDPNNRSLHVLDVGGGLLSINRLLSTKKSFVVDICIDKLKQAGFTLNDNVIYLTGQGEAIPFRNNTFDFIFTTNALDHFESPPQALREIKHVIKPNGYFIVAIDVFPEEKERWDQRHPYTYTEQTIKELLLNEFDILQSWNQPQGGKVGFGQLVRGETKPNLNKKESIFLLEPKNREQR